MQAGRGNMTRFINEAYGHANSLAYGHNLWFPSTINSLGLVKNGTYTVQGFLCSTLNFFFLFFLFLVFLYSL